MDREKLMRFAYERYGVSADYPWEKSPSFAVLRHQDNKKWFALIMDIPQSKLGFADGKIIDVVNLKCDPVMIGSVREEYGIYPAYHMNKASWITVLLDGSVSDEKIKLLLDMSYDLTDSVKKPKRNIK